MKDEVRQVPAGQQGIGRRTAGLFARSGLVLGCWRVVSRSAVRVLDALTTLAWRLSLREMGAGSLIRFGAAIEAPRFVRIGERCSVQGTSSISSEGSGELTLDNNVQINRGVHLDHTGGLRIEANVLVSEGAYISTHSHGYDPRGPAEPTALVVGPGVWIGAWSRILPGTHRIGEGAVIGACAVVTKEVPPGAIVAGNPSRVIGSTRHDNE